MLLSQAPFTSQFTSLSSVGWPFRTLTCVGMRTQRLGLSVSHLCRFSPRHLSAPVAHPPPPQTLTPSPLLPSQPCSVCLLGRTGHAWLPESGHTRDCCRQAMLRGSPFRVPRPRSALAHAGAHVGFPSGPSGKGAAVQADGTACPEVMTGCTCAALVQLLHSPGPEQAPVRSCILGAAARAGRCL